MVDADPVLRRRGKLVPIEFCVDPGDDRPRLSMGGRFACEVPGIEFFEGGVDVIGVEPDPCRRSVVGVDLDDAEHFGTDFFGLQPSV